MKRFSITMLTVVGLAAATLALQGPARAHAQEVEVKGPLAGAPAVIGLRVYREMRLQIQLQGSLTLTDEFSRTIFAGAQAMFHPTDWLGLGLWFGLGAVHIDTNLTDQVAAKGQTNSVNVLSLPRPGDFAKQIGHIKWIAAPEVQFIPLRGKLGIFEKLFVDTDFYVFGGVGFVNLEERANVDSNKVSACRAAGTSGGFASEIDCLDDTQTARATRTAIAPTFGAGLSLYIADFMAMTIEWRGLPFAWNTSGTDESGDARGDFPDGAIDEKDQLSHFNHMISLGFAFYLPTTPRLSTAGNE